jgi:hypothetical protein
MMVPFSEYIFESYVLSPGRRKAEMGFPSPAEENISYAVCEVVAGAPNQR